VTDLPSPATSPGTGIEPRRPGQLTPAELQVRRRNRQWFVILGVPAIVLGVAALAAAIVADQSSPSLRPVDVPSGFKAISDGSFAYSVPTGWSTNDLYSDDVGDLDTAGATGWAAEHLGVRATPPVRGETPPTALRAFGLAVPTSFDISTATDTTVTGTTTAYRYEVTRPGGFEAVAVDAWQQASGAEMWLLIHAPPTVTAQILASLRG
jgi:hypothetical protein